MARFCYASSDTSKRNSTTTTTKYMYCFLTALTFPVYTFCLFISCATCNGFGMTFRLHRDLVSWETWQQCKWHNILHKAIHRLRIPALGKSSKFQRDKIYHCYLLPIRQRDGKWWLKKVWIRKRFWSPKNSFPVRSLFLELKLKTGLTSYS